MSDDSIRIHRSQHGLLGISSSNLLAVMRQRSQYSHVELSGTFRTRCIRLTHSAMIEATAHSTLAY
jgi:hypothetical protein